MTFITGKARKSFLMGRYLLDNLKTDKSVAMEFISGLTQLVTKETGIIIKWEVKELIVGVMVVFTQVNGIITICTAMESINFQMDQTTTVIMLMIKEKDLEPSPGQISVNIQDSGSQERCMEKVLIQTQLESSLKEFGLKAIGHM